jgi:hypothetical protein
MTNLIQRLLVTSLISLLASCGGGGSSENPPNQTGDVGNNADNGGAAVSTVLPRIYIDVQGGEEIANTEDYQNATIRVLSATGTEELQAATEIRGRGNTTWGLPKKPYRLKLGQAASLLGLPAERDWALLANYADKTLVRSKLAMELGEKAGLTYNPRSKFFELYFNGDYRGVYQIFEHVEVGPNRVNVTKLDPEEDSNANITGGYFMEIDHRFGEDVCWTSPMNIPFCFKDPEYEDAQVTNPALPAFAQYNYITNYITDAEQSLAAGGTGYQQYFDVDALVSSYLVQELLKNNDAKIMEDDGPDGFNFTSSVFIHKPRDGKLTFGPLWDFDLSAGNVNYNGNDSPQGWWIRDSVWHSLLFANPDFEQRVFAKWCQLRSDGTIPGLSAQVDRIVASIDPEAVNRNFQRWDVLGKQAFVESYIGQTYQDETNYLKSWLNTRAAWMHSQFTQKFGDCPSSVQQ